MTTRKTFLATILFVSLLTAIPAANAQTETAKADAAVNRAPEMISGQLGEAILSELRQIRLLLQRQQIQQAAPPAAPKIENVKVSSNGYSLGQADAPLTLVEFADYQCPFCKQFHTAVFDRLKRDYIETGKLRFVSRDLPLDMHSNAFEAAQAARCSGEQDKFWQMREILIAHSDALGMEAVANYARQLSLDLPRFRSCLQSGKYLPGIREDIADAGAAEIYGTPTFVLGKTTGNRIEGMKIVGTQTYESLEKLLIEYSIGQSAARSSDR